MDKRADTAARALVVLLLTGCDAALPALAVAGARPQPLVSPVRPLEPSPVRVAWQR